MANISIPPSPFSADAAAGSSITRFGILMLVFAGALMIIAFIRWATRRMRE
ncbi:hypothetical protein GOV04_05115 [Candidatus Woesearchaeota archaeon]|nr:hypothetical protein [Candidatus Woesearchaeota archaeon]